ncbi:GxGYxYP domain-containing protein [Paenibacillus prosopidis]|uniref:GxGYxY motif-containing protein n=1 Tax=Paenibacillus prosopidis TaxID=630520 RepID=A0A368W3R6_9BACL|nr:GxGYxYP domain-containing protein [Paenibacillus prosopidis]RCW49437.1 GxGYxY motif-containing protein [Paenibacillus prosopidis]
MQKLFALTLTVCLFGALLAGWTTSYADARSDSNQQGGTYYEKAAYRAEKLNVIRLNDMSETESVMIASLQGLIANKTSEQIYILPESGNYGLWLTDLKDKYGVKLKYYNDPWMLLKKYKKYFNGYLLWQQGNSSINAASSLAHLKDAVLLEQSDVTKAEDYKQVMDLTGKDENWVKENYWNQLKHNLLIEQKEEMGPKLRDYAAMTGAFMFYDGNSAFRNAVMAEADDDSVVLGWGDASRGEDQFIMPSSEAGLFTLPADHAFNLSVLSGFELDSLKQKASEPPAAEYNVHYVSFVMSDGDNIQWMLNDLGEKGKPWFGNENRGSFDMGWAVSPSMIDLAPSVVNRFYEDATGKDAFVVGPSGGGYMYPSKYPAAELDQHLERLNNYMGRMDLGLVEVIDFNAFNNAGLWDKYTAQPNVDGVIYLEYSNHKALNGAIKWANGKPVITPREMLWQGNAGSDNASVVNHINAAPRNPKSAAGYSLVLVHAWSKSMDDVKAVIDQLDDDVRVVTPVEMVGLIKEQVPQQNNDIPNKVYQAETDFGHNTGKQDGDGWSANEAEHAAGHMLFGPGAADIKAGRHHVKFKTMINNHVADNNRVLNLDIYDATDNRVVAEKAVSRSQFQASNVYQNLVLEADFVQGHAYEFRVWYDGNANVKIDSVTVVMDSNLAQRIYEAENDFGHNTGKLDGDGWTANKELHGPGHMLYGPYVADIPTGVHDITFKAMISGGSDTDIDERVALLDVYSPSLDQVIISKDLMRSDFAAPGVYQDYTLIDVPVSLGSTYEFRVYYDDTANIKVDHVRLDMPDQVVSETNAIYFKFGGGDVESLALGTDAEEKQLQAWGKAVQAGKPDVNLTAEADWSVVSGSDVVSISDDGLLKVLGSGAAIVKSAYNGLEAELPIFVANTYAYRLFEAESEFGHNTGASAGDSWSANMTEHSAGHMLHGPGVSDLPSGSHKVMFRMKIDINTGNANRVLNLDIFDGTGNRVVGEKAILRTDFTSAGVYQDFVIDADFVDGHAYQFRVWYDDNATIHIDNVSVRVPVAD